MTRIQEQKTAQKGFILDQEKKRILVIKYGTSQYSPKVNGKYGFPGGQIEFGEEPDIAFIREVEEETGITIEPSIPFYVYTWTYQKGEKEKQIVALARLGFYKSGSPQSESRAENESHIELAEWVDLDRVNLEDFVENERPVLEAYFSYRAQNPFQ